MTTTARGRYRKLGRLTHPLAVAVAFVTGVVLLIGACSADQAGSSGSSGTSGTQVSANPRVLYEVEGTTDWASVTMATPTGTQQINPDVPMVREDNGEPGLEFTAPAGTFVYISAQNKRDHGTISCRITVDGVVISENESSGGYAIASCDGTA